MATQDVFKRELAEVLSFVEDLLIQKNAAYGDSALNPIRVFSKAGPVDGIEIRIDDKISRLLRGEKAGEDVEIDLLGYLVLLQIARRREAAAKDNS